MKRIFKITAIFLVVAVIFGCHEEPELVEPQAPTLIEPEDGAVFDTLLPENFIWSADGWKEEFYLYLAVGSVAETLIISGDTSIQFTPLSGLDGTIDASYKWAVASIAEDEALWSDINSFTISTMKYGPTLLSPDDSSEAYGQSLVFSWTSDRPADMYTIYILSDYLIFQNVSDTFYDMSSSEYSDLQAGDYTWYVTRHVGDWRFPSETRHFTIAEPLDLDITYFPFGLGYEWRYEEHYHGYDNYEPFGEYDTVTISVINSFWDGDTLKFELDGIFEDLPNPVCIFRDSIMLELHYLDWVLTHPISLVDQPELSGFISYSGETMIIYMDDGSEGSMYYNWVKTSRIKGIGAVYKGHGYEYWPDPYAWSSSSDYRLLYFYNGQDTVYKAE